MEWVGRRLPLAHLSPFVMAAKAAIHDSHRVEAWMDPGLRRDDGEVGTVRLGRG